MWMWSYGVRVFVESDSGSLRTIANSYGTGLGALVIAISLASCTALAPTPGQPSVTAPSAEASTNETSSEDASEDSYSPENFEWGEYPPQSFENLRDLSDPAFPKQLLSFTLDSVSEGMAESTGSYIDVAAVTTISARVLASPTNYEVIVDTLQDVDYYGKAVCGRPTSAPHQTRCLMIGQVDILSVGTAAELPIEDVAAFTEQIYAVL